MPKKSDLEKWNDSMYVAHPTPYHNPVAGKIERARLRKIVELCDVKKSDRIIEIGCEQGILLDAMPDCEEKVGVDISEVALKDAKRRLGRKAKLINADAEKKLKLPERYFDVVICSQTLEHVRRPDKMLDNIYRIAKDDARIVISVPNEVFMLRIKTFLKNLGVLQYLFPGIEEGVSEWHLQVFTDKLVKKFTKKKFRILEHRRAFNVYLIYLLGKRV